MQERQQAQSVRKEFQEKVQHFEREREDLAEKQKVPHPLSGWLVLYLLHCAISTAMLNP